MAAKSTYGVRFSLTESAKTGEASLINRANRKESDRLTIRVSAELKDKYCHAAELRGETLSRWAKRALGEAAEREIRSNAFAALALEERADLAKFVINA